MEAASLRGYTEKLKKPCSTIFRFRHCSKIRFRGPDIFTSIAMSLFYTAYKDRKMYSTWRRKNFRSLASVIVSSIHQRRRARAILRLFSLLSFLFGPSLTPFTILCITYSSSTLSQAIKGAESVVFQLEMCLRRGGTVRKRCGDWAC